MLLTLYYPVQYLKQFLDFGLVVESKSAEILPYVMLTMQNHSALGPVKNFCSVVLMPDFKGKFTAD